MTVTVVGLLPKQQQAVAHHLPDMKLRFLRECRQRDVGGLTVFVTNFVGHREREKVNRRSSKVIVHTGGTTTLIEKLKHLAPA